MPYRFTIVDERTLQPITGQITFKDAAGFTVRTLLPVPVTGIELGDEIKQFSAVVVTAPGYSDYMEPMDFLPGDYEFRMRKDKNWWPLVLVAAFVGIVAHHFYTEKPRKNAR